MTTPPFERTTCGCADCVGCCKKQPGSLAPGDFERIAAFLGESVEDATRHVWASPGAVVMDSTSGRMFRIGTITPRFAEGRCVFLQPDDTCQVHPVAPFGCAYCDPHMSVEDGRNRSAWHLIGIMQSEDYQRLRATLVEATSYNPRRT